MRSGNGPLAFKNMGSSPANDGVKSSFNPKVFDKEDNVIETDILFQKSRVDDPKGKPVKPKKSESDRERAIRLNKEHETQQALLKNPLSKEYKEAKKANEEAQKQTDHQARVKELNRLTGEKEAKEEVDATRGTTYGQKRKKLKLDNIQANQDKKYQKQKTKAFDKVMKKMNKAGTLEDKLKQEERENEAKGKDGSRKSRRLGRKIKKTKNQQKKWEGKETLYEGSETSDKETRREKRLKNEVNMTPDEYNANQDRKRKELFAGLEGGLTGLGADIGNAYGPGGSGTITSNMKQREAGEKKEATQSIYDAMNNSKLSAYRKENSETPTSETPATNPFAGHSEDVKFVSSASTDYADKLNKKTT
tara:strand:+ start:1 stop:1089 length:1089 start_codon:yes stop_codon:yes gene_type:complete